MTHLFSLVSRLVSHPGNLLPQLRPELLHFFEHFLSLLFGTSFELAHEASPVPLELLYDVLDISRQFGFTKTVLHLPASTRLRLGSVGVRVFPAPGFRNFRGLTALLAPDRPDGIAVRCRVAPFIPAASGFVPVARRALVSFIVAGTLNATALPISTLTSSDLISSLLSSSALAAGLLGAATR